MPPHWPHAATWPATTLAARAGASKESFMIEDLNLAGEDESVDVAKEGCDAN